ncbi:MAG TPA: metallophosphoesterase [Allosphingosinicella sp.]
MRVLRWLGILFLALFLLLAFMFAEARRMPAMRTATIALPNYPAGAKPLRVALLTDTHMGGPDQSPERLRRIVAEIDAQHPDLILLGGDFLGERKYFGRAYTPEEAVAPFAGLRAPLGVLAVLGNHDFWDGPEAAEAALRRLGILVLHNQAVRRGPLAIGGIGDSSTDHADPAATLAAARGLGGAPLFFSHGPDVFPRLPAGTTLLVGHTHCGQIALPFVGAIAVPSDYGSRYACGRYREGGKTMIVSGGVGTSVVPLRFWAPPDWWLVTITGGQPS